MAWHPMELRPVGITPVQDRPKTQRSEDGNQRNWGKDAVFVIELFTRLREEGHTLNEEALKRHGAGEIGLVALLESIEPLPQQVQTGEVE